MAGGQIAWVTHAPADYMLVYTEDPNGEHTLVSAFCEDEGCSRDLGLSLEGAELGKGEVHAYCTLPGEADRVLARIEEACPLVTSVECGTIVFVAVGSGSATTQAAADGRRNTSARVVVSGGGYGPRCYRFEEQCAVCGEFRGKVNVLPRGAVLLDTRTLGCRCASIPCRYCDDGRVRRPLTEHFDPERRAGSVPWFGYLVPCGGCQVAERGPRVQMST